MRKYRLPHTLTERGGFKPLAEALILDTGGSSGPLIGHRGAAATQYLVQRQRDYREYALGGHGVFPSDVYGRPGNRAISSPKRGRLDNDCDR